TANKDGWTPLLKASEKGRTEIVKLLLAAKADVNAANKDGWTPLYIASEKEQTEIIKMLQEAKLSADKQ
ncbi:MAG: ankyrin repeat domain-containing protein, partial [Deltaproteobacteria bacterium]|nr:ankyrin repeat domain-containing protein [Deltaproteobacteria bacterium]